MTSILPESNSWVKSFTRKQSHNPNFYFYISNYCHQHFWELHQHAKELFFFLNKFKKFFITTQHSENGVPSEVRPLLFCWLFCNIVVLSSNIGVRREQQKSVKDQTENFFCVGVWMKIRWCGLLRVSGCYCSRWSSYFKPPLSAFYTCQSHTWEHDCKISGKWTLSFC